MDFLSQVKSFFPQVDSFLPQVSIMGFPVNGKNILIALVFLAVIGIAFSSSKRKRKD